jgi:hypothetical protein
MPATNKPPFLRSIRVGWILSVELSGRHIRTGFMDLARILLEMAILYIASKHLVYIFHFHVLDLFDTLDSISLSLKPIRLRKKSELIME